MKSADKTLYSQMVGKAVPTVGLLALLGVATEGDIMGEGAVGLPTWITIAALVVGIAKVMADAWAAYRKNEFVQMQNRALEAEERARAKSDEAERLQREVYELKASLRLAKTAAEQAGVSQEALALEDASAPIIHVVSGKDV